jgi:hypothetical protein
MRRWGGEGTVGQSDQSVSDRDNSGTGTKICERKQTPLCERERVRVVRETLTK